MTSDASPGEPLVIGTMRRLLLLLVAFGTLGTAADLLLLEHYESAWQVAPLALTGIALIVIAWLFFTSSRSAVTAMQVAMVACMVAGCLGILLHYNGNREFQREIDPTLAGWALVMKVIRAKAPPALAPASMIQLGLLGLVSTYRHPSLRSSVPRGGAQRSTR